MVLQQGLRVQQRGCEWFAGASPGTDTAFYFGRVLPQASVAVFQTFFNLTEGVQGSFAVSLGAQPTGNVVITLASSNTSVAMVSPATLTFAPASYNVAQTVNITTFDNFVVDGTRTALVALSNASSSDPAYAGLAVPSVSIQVNDNDAVSAC